MNIKKQLTDYMESLTIDLWGYEKKFHENACKYLNKAAMELGVNTSRVLVRLTRSTDSLRVFLHTESRLSRELTISELVQFFTGQTVLTSQVASGLLKFTEDFAHEKGIDPEQLQVLISARGKKASVFSYHEANMEEVPVKVLIKYFTK